jgi:RNA polymerase sigma-70 factor, ECF subfamily
VTNLSGDSGAEMQLVREAQNGGDYALARLLQENYAVVFRFMRKLTLDPQLAADVTQDCMERAIEKFSLFDPQKSAFSTWLITIAKNLWIEECRRSGRRRKLSEKYADFYTPTADTTTEFEQNDELSCAIKALDNKHRVPLLMKHAGGYSYEEIARALKIPLGTVKSRISNGIKILKKELENNDG